MHYPEGSGRKFMSGNHSPDERQSPGQGGEEELEQLGLNSELLTTSVLQGVSRAQDITTFHPVTARGFTQWSETVASLREQLDERGWTRSNPQNSPRIISPDGKTSIIVAGGNAQTGRSHEIVPSTARRRGPATRSAVQCNGQGMLDISLAMPAGWNPGAELGWVLLYHWSTDEPTVRAEISLPTEIDDGIIKNWNHRILLPPQDLTSFVVSQRPDEPMDEVDFRIVEHS